MAAAAKEIKVETPPFDARFPNTNQTKNCYQNYLDYHACVEKKGEDYQPCIYFKRVYNSLCPTAWVSLGGGGGGGGVRLLSATPINAHL